MAQPEMEITFITFHDLTPQATITFASESITEILGWRPDEVKGKSCFEYFHPDEVPLAQYIHNRNVQLDKAAALHYARIKARDGQWVSCECVFTVVYNALVSCTSIYRGDDRNERRAAEAPTIRRIFSSSPKDPRYHMLEHLSSKFRTPILATPLESRAALMLNRFSREANVMYSTSALEIVLGITPGQFHHKSFYACLQEQCLPEAVRVMEQAKANDSIAYLRFMYRNPLTAEDQDEAMADASQSDSDDGGVELESHVVAQPATRTDDPVSTHSRAPLQSNLQPPMLTTRTSSDRSTDLGMDAADALFDTGARPDVPAESSSSSTGILSADERKVEQQIAATLSQQPPTELEAVISCSSDGLVVVLRRARPLPPPEPRRTALALPTIAPGFPAAPVPGFFAAPWAPEPVHPHAFQPNEQSRFRHGFNAVVPTAQGPPQEAFLQSIREVAVFAWALTGINGHIHHYHHGVAQGQAISQTHGLPIWDPYAQPRPTWPGPHNQAVERWRNIGPTYYEQRQGPYLPYQRGRRYHGRGPARGSSSQRGRGPFSISHRRRFVNQQVDYFSNLHGDIETVQQQNWSRVATSTVPTTFPFQGTAKQSQGGPAGGRT